MMDYVSGLHRCLRKGIAELKAAIDHKISKTHDADKRNDLKILKSNVEMLSCAASSL